LRFDLDRALNLEVEGRDQGLLYRGFDSLLDTGANEVALGAAPYGRLSGIVRSDSGAVTGIALPGTSFHADVGADQAYALERVPGESYPTLIQVRSGGGTLEFPGATLRAGPDSVTSRNIGVTVDRMVLEDFSQPWPNGLITALSGKGGWHEVRDIGAPLLNRSTLSRLLIGGPGSYDGVSMKMTCVLDSLYSGIGLHLGRGAPGIDWTGLRSVSFAAKGKGKVRLTVESLMLDSLGQDQFGYLITLPAAWTRIEIPVDSLRLAKGSPAETRGISWIQSARSITRLEFVVKRDFAPPGDTTEMWIDDFNLVGVPLRVFAP